MGSAILKIRTIKSLYADVPPSLEFAIIRRVRHPETNATKENYLCHLGRINGWVMAPKSDFREYRRVVEENKIHRHQRVHVQMMNRPKTLKNFFDLAEQKIEALVMAKKISPEEKEKLLERLKDKVPF